MRGYIVSICLINCLVTTYINAIAQDRYYNKRHNLHITKNLPRLIADPCLQNLLKSIVKSNSKYYKGGESFYHLEYFNKKNFNYLGIYLDQWNNITSSDYSALMKVKGTLFLCKGNILSNSLFHKVRESKGRLEFNILKSSSDIPITMDPSLQGTFNSCKGLPIYIEVYTPEPISGYRMKIKQH